MSEKTPGPGYGRDAYVTAQPYTRPVGIIAGGGPDLDAAVAETRQLRTELDEARGQLREVYRERARLVAFLAACYPSVMLTDSAEPDWPIVFVSTPAGQLSWHIAKADLYLFALVPETTEPTWDGHTTEAKYERLAELTGRITESGGFAGILATTVQAGSALAAAMAERDRLQAAYTAACAALRNIALGIAGDPSVAADHALVATHEIAPRDAKTAPGLAWLHVGCGGRVVFDHSGGFCTGCEAEGLAPGDYEQEEPAVRGLPASAGPDDQP